MNWPAAAATFIATSVPFAAVGFLVSESGRNACTGGEFPGPTGECELAYAMIIVITSVFLAIVSTVAFSLAKRWGHQAASRGILAGLMTGLVIAFSRCAVIFG